MEYAMLSHLQLQSSSDQEDYRLYPSIAVGESAGVLPEQLAVWSYPLAKATPDEASFNMVSAMLFRIHQSGNLVEAERLYLHLMATAPLAANAPHLLGVLRAQQGRNLEALALMDQSLALNADAPEVLANQANVLKAEGRLAEALDRHRAAVALNRQVGTGHRYLLTALDLLARTLADLGQTVGEERQPGGHQHETPEIEAVGRGAFDPRERS